MRRGAIWAVVAAAGMALAGAAFAGENVVEDDTYLAAVQLFNQHDWEAARRSFTDFLRAFPRSRWLPGVRLRLADLEPDPALAEKAYADVLAAAAGTDWAGDARWALANTCFALGKYADAANHFQLLVQAGDPRRARALYLAGRSQAALGRSASAKTFYTQVRDDFPRSPEAELALAGLGDLEAAARRPGPALAMYDQYLKEFPEGQLAEYVQAQREPLLAARAPAAAEPTAAASGGEPATGEPASTGMSGGEAFTVQVGAFTKPEYADKLMKRLRRKGYNAYLLSAKSGSELFHQVRVGNYARRNLAEVFAAKLAKQEGLPTLVLTYTKPENP
jgi:cell division septation protein DedD